MRADRAAMDFSPWCTAAEPVAHAFSTRVARLKRRSGAACSTSDAVKSCAEKPALKCPRTISSTSFAAIPASSSASFVTRTTRLSTVSPASFPKGVCAHPTMQAVIDHSLAEFRSLLLGYGCIANPQRLSDSGIRLCVRGGLEGRKYLRALRTYREPFAALFLLG